MRTKNANMFESLLEKTKEYSKISIELSKLRAIDKTVDVISSFIPRSIVFILVASFMLFFNLGLAFWLSEILGHISYGFFVVAALYAIMGLIIHFFMHKRLKINISDFFLKLLLK